MATSMLTVAKFLEVGIIEPQKKFILEDIKAARQVRKKYDRAKQEVFSGEEALETLTKQNKPTASQLSDRPVRHSAPMARLLQLPLSGR